MRLISFRVNKKPSPFFLRFPPRISTIEPREKRQQLYFFFFLFFPFPFPRWFPWPGKQKLVTVGCGNARGRVEVLLRTCSSVPAYFHAQLPFRHVCETFIREALCIRSGSLRRMVRVCLFHTPYSIPFHSGPRIPSPSQYSLPRCEATLSVCLLCLTLLH